MKRIVYIVIVLLTACSPLSSKKKIEGTDTTIIEKKNFNGKVYETESYYNGKLDGPTKVYYDNGKVKYIRYYKNGEWTGETRSYTPQGKLATIRYNEQVSGNKDSWRTKTEIIYWEEIPVDTEEFLFVSDSGFYRVKDYKYTNLDSAKVDNIFVEKSYRDSVEFYILKNGKKEYYKTIRRND